MAFIVLYTYTFVIKPLNFNASLCAKENKELFLVVWNIGSIFKFGLKVFKNININNFKISMTPLQVKFMHFVLST